MASFNTVYGTNDQSVSEKKETQQATKHPFQLRFLVKSKRALLTSVNNASLQGVVQLRTTKQ